MTRRSDGLWQESVVINGRRKFFYGKTKQAVKAKINAYREESEKGITLKAVASEWYEDILPRLSPNSVHGYKTAMERAVQGLPKHLSEIAPSDVDSYLKRISRELNMAQKTAENHLLVVRSMMSFAVLKGYIQFNPAREVSVPKNLAKTRRAVADEIEIEKMKRLPPSPLKTQCMLALYAGLRRGEIIALRWSDINFFDKSIMVSRSCAYNGNAPVIKLPKTESSFARVPLHPLLGKYLSSIKDRGELVSPSPDGDLWKNSELQKAYEKYQKENGISFTLHQLRHYYATVLWESGITPDEAQLLLRHSTIGMTMDTYRDIREEKRESIFAKMRSVAF